jgi:hypothetical protein
LTIIFRVINNEYDYSNRAEVQLFLNLYIELHKQMRMLAAALTDGDKRPTVTTKDPADKVKGPYNDRSDNNIGL